MRKNKQVILTILITLALVSVAWSAGLGRDRVITAHYVVAGEAILAGSQIRLDQLDVAELPVKVAGDCYARDPGEVAGKWTNSDLQKGELISSHRLFQKAAGIQYPDAGQDRRLLTISLDPAEANGFWLAAGNLVDLILVPKSRENGLQIQVMERISILAVLNGDSSEGGLAKVQSKTLLCLDLDTSQVMMLCNSYGLYDIHLAVINEPP
jgi:Flp pilus assembly protein CpaB